MAQSLFTSIFSLFFIFITNTSTAQCDLLLVGTPMVSSCDDGGTPSDPSDDMLTYRVNVFNNVTDQSILETFTFSSGTNIVTVNIQDPNVPNCNLDVDIQLINGCMECMPMEACIGDIMFLGPCEALINIDITLPPGEIKNLTAAFQVNGKDIESVSWAQNASELPGSGLSLDITNNGFSFNNNTLTKSIKGENVSGTQVVIRVSTIDPMECFTVERVGIAGYINSTNETCFANPCSESAETCLNGLLVSGKVNVWDADCPGGSAIEGAEVNIQSLSGAPICNETTGANGGYECRTCDDGPYEICIENQCDRPCDLTSADIFFLQRVVLGIELFSAPYFFLGDITGDDRVTSADLLILAKVLNGTYDNSFNFCRFVPDVELLSLSGQASLDDLTALQGIDNCIIVPSADAEVNFTQFNVGDLNGSCTDCTHGDGMGDLPLVISGNDDGYVIDLPYTETVLGYSFDVKFSFPESAEITLHDSEKVDFVLNNGTINIIWYAEELDDAINTPTQIFIKTNEELTDDDINGVIHLEKGIHNAIPSILNKDHENIKFIQNNGYIEVIEEIRSLRIFDSSGGLLVDSKNSKVDISGLKAGLYIMVVETESRRIITEKIVCHP